MGADKQQCSGAGRRAGRYHCCGDGARGGCASDKPKPMAQPSPEQVKGNAIALTG